MTLEQLQARWHEIKKTPFAQASEQLKQEFRDVEKQIREMLK